MRSGAALNRDSKILQLANSLGAADGGPARNAFELNQALNAIPGISVQLVSMNGELGLVHDHIRSNLAIQDPRPLGMGSSGASHDSVSFWHLVSRLRNADSLIVHGYFLWWVPIFVGIARLFRVRVALMPHGSLTSHQQKFSRRKKAAFELLAGWWMRRSVWVFATGSEIEAHELRERFPRVSARVTGVGTRIPSTPSLSPIGDPISLLTMSRLAPKKRVDLCIAAAGVLLSRGVRVQLDIAGDGDSHVVDALHDQVIELGITEHVRFLGLVTGEEKEMAFTKADVFLLPSEDENFGIGVAEAAAHGVPVVSSAAVAAASMLSVESRELVSSLSATALANSIELVANDYGGRRQAVRNDAIRLFSWEAVASRWMDALQSPR
ncbi:glycosyltransferase involved in cell wall biosynthesis [Leifsonia sp. AK011]|uniref:glycosyltransferase n=1 Tax=Leifsonia sp. AK011 TaxID=2723075 RepID=UPI0015CA04A9|nr:glycosyltransferase [Leifsonia sp. AK011]NYF11670.1 glycosyltransferase involved in cell wall biosynthesis [Leifsonia sp. AK011]